MSTSGATVPPSGQRHRAFYRYGLLTNPNLRIYKPWLDQTFIDELGGRAEMSAFMAQHGHGYKNERRKGLQHRQQHAGRHPRSQRPGRTQQRHRIVNPIMGVAFWKDEVEVKREEVTIRFEEGRPWPSTAWPTPIW